NFGGQDGAGRFIAPVTVTTLRRQRCTLMVAGPARAPNGRCDVAPDSGCSEGTPGDPGRRSPGNCRVLTVVFGTTVANWPQTETTLSRSGGRQNRTGRDRSVPESGMLKIFVVRLRRSSTLVGGGTALSRSGAGCVRPARSVASSGFEQPLVR